jgi:hypothetical protein
LAPSCWTGGSTGVSLCQRRPNCRPLIRWIYALQCSSATIVLFVSARSMSANCFKRSVFDRSRALALATVAFERPDLAIAVSPECVRIATHQVCVTRHARRTRDRGDVRDVAQDRRRLSHGNNAMRDRRRCLFGSWQFTENIFGVSRRSSPGEMLPESLAAPAQRPRSGPRRRSRGGADCARPWWRIP